MKIIEKINEKLTVEYNDFEEFKQKRGEIEKFLKEEKDKKPKITYKVIQPDLSNMSF